MHAPEQFDAGLMWFRRDLRCQDNAALFHALRSCRRVYCVFVFDSELLDPLPRADRRVEFIHHSVRALDAELRELAAASLGSGTGAGPGMAAGAAGANGTGSAGTVPDPNDSSAPGQPAHGLIVLHGPARTLLPELAQALHVQAVFTNHDYEPAAIARDNQVRGGLANAGISLRTTKDHVVFERDEVLTTSGTPHTQFSSYCAQWLAQLTPFHLRAYEVEAHAAHLAPRPAAWRQPLPSLQDLGFHATNLGQLALYPGTAGAQAQWQEFAARMDHYHLTRDYPAVRGPSYLGVHLRFGTLGIREVARLAWERYRQGDPGATKWLVELVWREFYIQLLAHFPHVVEHAFQKDMDRLPWDHGAHGRKLFAAWCAGQTGFPLVDAGMRQLHATGYMHNRLRMVAASFLTRQLGVDWRWGERHFAEHLNDYELASNNGNWQWAAGTGCDAQSWFRIFNPTAQSLQYDAQGKFLRRYLPELARLPDEEIHAPERASPIELEAAGITLGLDYPAPIVDLGEARRAALQRHAALRQERRR